MKYFSKLLLAAVGFLTIFSACNKVGDLPHYALGTVPVLSSSTTTTAPAAADSNSVAITFAWSDPNYSNLAGTSKFILQIDSAGRNFSKAVSKTVIGTDTVRFLAKELNNILLGYGFNYNVPYHMEARLISSYGNNNEQYTSNTIALTMAAYVTPPKITPPASGRLFLVGSATQGGWNNPVPVPTQEFAQLDSVTYAGVFNLNASSQYLVLPENGNWGKKFAVQDNSIPGLSAGGDFGYHQDGQPAPDVYTSNFPGPSTAGWYIITIDFQRGKFTVVPFTGNLPSNLFIVGDATPGGWNNPVPTPSQQFTQLNSSIFQITLALSAGHQYLFLPVNGDWSHKYAVADNTIAGLSAGGDFGYDLGSNFPGPAAAGNYKITANFVTSKFTCVAQ